MEEKETAHSIARSLLKRTGAAMRDGRFDEVLRCFGLPVVLETLDGLRLLRNETDVLEVFNDVREFRKKNDIIKLDRECVSASFIDEQTITTMHVAKMIKADGTRYKSPYPAYSVLRNLGGIWRITFCQYGIEDAPQLSTALCGKANAAHSSAALHETVRVSQA